VRALELAWLVAASASVNVDERLGAPVPLTARFRDTGNREGALGEFLSRRRPTLLVLAYHRCTTLCELLLSRLPMTLRALPDRLGVDYDLVVVSFDPEEAQGRAADARARFLAALAVPATADAPFLAGDASAIAALTQSLGFGYRRDPATGQFAHPQVMFVLTPDGRIARYLYGVEFPPRQLRLALTEAAAGKSRRTLDRVLLTCYRYDPARRRYHLAVTRFVRGGGAMIAVVLGLWFARMWLRERRDQKLPPPPNIRL
jgi:protein SCO1/2